MSAGVMRRHLSLLVSIPRGVTVRPALRRHAHISGFFKSNSPHEEDLDRKRAEISRLIRRPRVVDINGYYTSVLERSPHERSSFRGFFLINKDCKKSFEELDRLAMQDPVVGSFVEARTEDGDVVCGIVTSTPFGSFKKDLDTLEIITVESDFVLVRPSSVSFHINGLFSGDAIAKYLSSMDKKGFALLKYAIIELVDQTLKLLRETNALAIYSAPTISNKHRMVSPLLGEVAKVFDQMYIDKTLAPYKQYFAAHLLMCGNPQFWKVDSTPMFMRPGQFIDRLSLYQTLPLSLVSSITRVQSLKPEKFQKFRESLQAVLSSQNNSSDFVEAVKQVDHEDTNYIIDLLRYYIAYPHKNLEPYIQSVLGVSMKPNMAYQMLASSGYFSGIDKTPLCDFYQPQKESTAVDSARATVQIDHFKHIRTYLDSEKALTVNKDLPVIGFRSRKMDALGLSDRCDLAVSVEDLGMNKLRLNIHVPDVASFFSPRSKRFAHNKWGYLKDVQFADGQSLFMDKQIIKDISFLEKSGPKECITLSVIFNPEEPSSPWIQPDVDVLPDVIENVTIVGPNDLQSAFEKNSRISNLFKPSTIAESTLMKVRMILESHRRHRQEQGWLNVDMTEVVFSKEELIDEIFMDHKQQLELLAGELTAFFAHREAIPLLHTYQERKSTEPDEVHIKARSPFLPSFTASSYDHFLLDGGLTGSMSITGYTCALKLLEQPVFGLMNTKKPLKPLTSLGLHYGYSAFVGPLSFYEALLNQYQLLRIAHRSYMSQNRGFNHDYLYYTGHITDSPSKMTGIPADGYGQWALSFSRMQAADYIVRESKRFHVLKALEAQFDLKFATEEQKLLPKVPEGNLDLTFFKCFVLESESYPTLARGYCVNLGIEVEILLPAQAEVMIGDKLICSEIVYLNAIESRIVLK